MIRWYVWTSNATLLLFIAAWASPVSFRAALSCWSFISEPTCDKYTGRIIYKEENRIDTTWTYAGNILKGISRSRMEFEAQPDTGLFAKACVRVCNLIWNYVFKLIIFLPLFLIIFPSCCVVVSTGALFLCVTSIVWVLLALGLAMIVCWLFYDFDYVESNENSYKTVECFALITEILRFVVWGIG